MSEVDTYIKKKCGNSSVRCRGCENHIRHSTDARVLVREYDCSRRESTDRTSYYSNPGRDCVWMVADWRGCAE